MNAWLQLTYSKRTPAPGQPPSTIAKPLESPFLPRLDPVTAQQAPPDVGGWHSAEELDSKSPDSERGSRKTLAMAPRQDAKERKYVGLLILLAVLEICFVAGDTSLVLPVQCKHNFCVQSTTVLSCSKLNATSKSGVCSVGKAGKDSGMVLPFDPMTMTFKDLHYFVPIAKVSSCRKIELAALSGIDC